MLYLKQCHVVSGLPNLMIACNIYPYVHVCQGSRPPHKVANQLEVAKLIKIAQIQILENLVSKERGSTHQIHKIYQDILIPV